MLFQVPEVLPTLLAPQLSSRLFPFEDFFELHLVRLADLLELEHPINEVLADETNLLR